MTKKTEKPWGPAEVESSNTGEPGVAAEAGTGADKQDKMTDISVVNPLRLLLEQIRGLRRETGAAPVQAQETNASPEITASPGPETTAALVEMKSVVPEDTTTPPWGKGGGEQNQDFLKLQEAV